MEQAALTLLVTYQARPGCREGFLRQLAAEGIIDAIRQEDGCLRYDYYLSIQDENEILLVEQWQTEAQQQAHLRRPHMEQLREIKEQYVSDTRLQRVRTD